jgi:(1->4)-alpha-D-glucan 1-alpha-D-glucosylmutase
MGIVLDIVPNHMATGEENPYWEDVLRHGPDSPYARWFDIDWDAAGRRVFLPVLGKRLGQAIPDGELSLALVSGRVRIRYFDQSFPVDPTTLPVLFDLIEKLVPQFATSTPAQDEGA